MDGLLSPVHRMTLITSAYRTCFRAKIDLDDCWDRCKAPLFLLKLIEETPSYASGASRRVGPRVDPLSGTVLQVLSTGESIAHLEML